MALTIKIEADGLERHQRVGMIRHNRDQTTSACAAPAPCHNLGHMSQPLQHIAIIMDGNGRWAKKRLLPRTVGHVRGAANVRQIVKAASEQGVKYLTLFAFSSENWRRPAEEVSALMGLFLQ